MVLGTESNLFDPVGHLAFLISLLQLYTSKLLNIIPEHEGEQVSFASASTWLTGSGCRWGKSVKQGYFGLLVTKSFCFHCNLSISRNTGQLHLINNTHLFITNFYWHKDVVALCGALLQWVASRKKKKAVLSYYCYHGTKLTAGSNKHKEAPFCLLPLQRR